jgi:type II secretory pathway pseudopilin PulG
MIGRQSGFSLVELLVIATIIGIIVAIAIPNLQQARLKSLETSAKGGVRLLVSAEASYLSASGNSSRYGLISDLIASNLIESSFNGVRSSYQYSITQPNGTGSYQIRAAPTGVGMKYFFARENGVILENTVDDIATAVPIK